MMETWALPAALVATLVPGLLGVWAIARLGYEFERWREPRVPAGATYGRKL